jgi:PAS domain S-box-containing protein
MSEVAQSGTNDIHFRDVFNASPIGVAVETLEGQPLFVNPAFCSMLGFSEEELSTNTALIFLPPKMRRRIGHFSSGCARARSITINWKNAISVETARWSGET